MLRTNSRIYAIASKSLASLLRISTPVTKTAVFASSPRGFASLAEIKEKLAGMGNIKAKMNDFFLTHVRDNNTDIVSAMLNEGMDVNTTVKGVTALHVTAQVGYEDMTKLLLAHKPTLEARDDEGYTPLLWAAARNHAPVVAELLTAGADVTASTPRDGFSPLHHACAAGNVPVATLLLDARANPDARAADGSTCVHSAVFANKTRVLELLLSRGAVPTLEHTPGLTPLFIAAYQGQADAVRALLAAGATADQASTTLGVTALAGAAAQGHEVCAQLLLDQGASVEHVDGDGLTPLQWARKNKHTAVEQLLLKAQKQQKKAAAAAAGITSGSESSSM